MSLSLVTGYAGTPHVTSTQQGAYNAGTFSKGKYVLNLGNKFAYELISNNLIRIKDGYAVNQGRFLGMDNGDYEELSIDNGLSGVKRSDLIVMRYAKNVDTGIETTTMMVIKGTSGDAYTDPEYCSGDILNGAVTDDLLLYRVNINGLSVESVDTLFVVKGNTEELLAVVQKQIDTLNGSLTVKSYSIETDATVLNSGSGVRLRKQGAFYYIDTQIQPLFDSMEAWSKVKIGTISDWTGEKINWACNLNALGYATTIPTLGLLIDSDGSIYIYVHGAASGIKNIWFAGRSTVYTEVTT